MTTGFPFTVVDVPQRCDEWFVARCGRLTSSMVKDIFSAAPEVKVKEGRKAGSESVDRRDLRMRLACEFLSGVPEDDGGFRSNDMQRGVDKEDDARMAYEVRTGRLVQQVGFLAHRSLRIGCSLDGFVGDFDGLVEFKCPKSTTHVGYLKDPNPPVEYLAQMRHQLLITGAAWCDFVSYDDRLPEGLRLCVRRLWATDALLPAYELAVRNFLSEVDREIEELEALRAEAALVDAA